MARVIFSRFGSNTHLIARNTARPYHRHNEYNTSYNSGLFSGMFQRNTYVLHPCLTTCRQNIAPNCRRLHTSYPLALLRNGVPENHSAKTTIAQKYSLRITGAELNIVYGLSEDNLAKSCNCLPTNDCQMPNVRVLYHLEKFPTLKRCDIPLAYTKHQRKFYTNNPNSTLKMYSEIIKMFENGQKPFITDLDKSSSSVDWQTLEAMCDQKCTLSIYSPIIKTGLKEPVKYTPALNPDKYSSILKIVKYLSLMQPVKYSMTLKQFKYNMTLQQGNYIPTLKSLKYSPTMNPIAYEETLRLRKYDPTQKPIKYSPSMKLTAYEETLKPRKYDPTQKPVKYSPIMKLIAYEGTLGPIKYGPTQKPGKYSSIMKPIAYEETLRLRKYDPTQKPIKYSPSMKLTAYEETLKPRKYDPTQKPVKYSPIMKLIAYEGTLGPIKYGPTQKPGKYSSIMKPIAYEETLRLRKYDPTQKPIKYSPSMKLTAYEETLKPRKYDPTQKPVKYSPIMKLIAYEGTLGPIKYGPTQKPGKYSSIMKPIAYEETLRLRKYDPTQKPIKYSPSMKLTAYEETLKPRKYDPTQKPVKYSPIMKLIAYEGTLGPIKYGPTQKPGKYSSIMKPIAYEETLRLRKYDPTQKPIKYSPSMKLTAYEETLKPRKYDPTQKPVKYSPIMKLIAYEGTLGPIKYGPTQKPGKYSSIMKPIAYEETLRLRKYDPTQKPIKYRPSMKPIGYDETLGLRKNDPTQKPVKYIPTMKKRIPALMSSILGSKFKKSSRTPTAKHTIVKHTIFGLTSVRGVQSIAPDIPSVTVFDMKRTLKQSGLPVVDGYTALTVKCMLCNAADDGTMYINKTTGSFICPKCHNHGDWGILQRVLKKGAAEESLREHFQLIQEERRTFQLTWKKVLEETTPLNKLNAEDAETLFRLFEYPYFEEAPKVLSEVRCDSARTSLAFPLRDALGAVVGYRAVRAGDERRPESFGRDAAGLFACKLGRSERAVLTPTVPDLLYLARDKVAGCLVWWHAGLLPPSVLPVLENFKRVCIWGGAENIRGVGDKLDHERCRFVRAIDGATTPSEAACAGAAAAGRLRAAVADAAPAAHRSITTFQALRDDVYANLTNAEKVRGVKWSRFPALSRLLGGHRRGELTVLTGATGCGKTTLTAEMSLDLAASGVNTLWGSFEIRNSRLAQTMLQQHAGVPLEQHLSEFNTLADQFQRLPIYFLAFHGPQPIATVMEAVEHARYVYDIAHVIIDNVQFMLGVGSGAGSAGSDHGYERYFKQDAVVAAFRTFATRRDCHVTLVMHPRKERDAEDLSTSSIFGSAKASQEADNVLIIQDKRLTAVRGKKYLQVAKNRYSGDLGIVPLEFDKAALSYRAKRRTRDKDDHRPDEEHQRQDGEEHRQDNHSREDGRRRSRQQKEGDGDSYLSEVLELDKDK